MKKELKCIIVIFVGFITLLWLAKPLREFLINYDITELNAKLTAGIITRLLIISVSLWIIGKLNLEKFNGLSKRNEISNLKALMIPSLFHGFVNFSFGTGDLEQEDIQIITEKITEDVNWNSIIPTTIFFTFIFLSGIYMTRKVDAEMILNKLNFKTATNKV
jgi:hypothetical protein